ncbi:eukaryotic translation initiation factor 3 subunit E [Terfezia claveryi]|nr:eukaryotic translation initiation factor 3 subunit E [Terfezia claveryi]
MAATDATAPLNGATEQKNYDLMPKMMPNLDRHLIFPLIENMEQQGIFPQQQIVQAKYDLLKHTNMTDYVGSLWKEIHDEEELPESFTKKREEVLEQLKLLEEKSAKVLELLETEEVISMLRSDKTANMKFLEETHKVTMDMVNAIYEYGQCQYQCGNYSGASDLLYHYRILSTDNEKTASASWGKLACEILLMNWEGAMEEINKVKELIEQKFNNPLGQLQHRTWLIHWCLFPFFNHEPARDALCELFFSPAYINTIQTSCPWILRYLAAAVITNRTRSRNSSQYQKQLKDLVRVVKQEIYEYTDPITEFVAALYMDFDFEEARRKLAQAEEVLKGDFFLAATTEAFVESARHLISESYCKIHQRIDIKDLSARLNLTQDEGEKWIVNLIRDTRVDAKIDTKDGTVLMNHPPQSIYQQVIERTRGGFFRTQVLTAAVSK